MVDTGKWLTVPEYCEASGLGESTVRKMVKEGKLTKKMVSARMYRVWFSENDEHPDHAGQQKDENIQTEGQQIEPKTTPEAPISAPVSVVVDGVGTVDQDAEIKALLLQKAKLLLKREVSLLESGIITKEDVDKFRAEQEQLRQDKIEIAAREEHLTEKGMEISSRERELDELETTFDKSRADIKAVTESLAKREKAVQVVESEQERLYRAVRDPLVEKAKTRLQTVLGRMATMWSYSQKFLTPQTVSDRKATIAETTRLFQYAMKEVGIKQIQIDENKNLTINGQPVTDWASELARETVEQK